MIQLHVGISALIDHTLFFKIESMLNILLAADSFTGIMVFF